MNHTHRRAVRVAARTPLTLGASAHTMSPKSEWSFLMAKKSGHGGKRRNAGRKPFHEKNMTLHVVYLPDELWEYAKQVGTHTTADGTLKQDAARGIRAALEFHRTLKHQFDQAADPDAEPPQP